MSTYTLKAHEVVKNREIVSTPRKPVAVNEFVSLLGRMITAEYCDRATMTISEDGSNFLTGLYNLAVFNGKEFKASIPQMGSGKRSGADSGIMLPAWVDCGLEIFTHKESLFAYVIRGSNASAGIQSEIYKLNDQSAVPILTYKLFQAVISILVVKYSVHKNLLPAKLFANVNLSCKVARAAADEDNWAVHGHSGINFVANYVHKISADPAKKQLYERLPSLEHVFMMAFRMDQSQRLQYQKMKLPNAFPTIDAIFRSTGLSTAESVNILNRLKESSKMWGESYVSQSNTMTTFFVDNLSKIEKGSAVPSSSNARSMSPLSRNDAIIFD